LIEVHADQLDLEREARHELREDVKQRVAVLPAGHRDHDPIARRQELIALAGVLDVPVETLLEPTDHLGHAGLLLDPPPGGHPRRPCGKNIATHRH